MRIVVPDAPGYIGGFLQFVDPCFREALRAIFDEYFVDAPEAEFADVVGRARRLASWISAPLKPEPSSVRKVLRPESRV
jgi:hypothetical protein